MTNVATMGYSIQFGATCNQVYSSTYQDHVGAKLFHESNYWGNYYFTKTLIGFLVYTPITHRINDFGIYENENAIRMCEEI